MEINLKKAIKGIILLLLFAISVWVLISLNSCNQKMSNCHTYDSARRVERQNYISQADKKNANYCKPMKKPKKYKYKPKH